MNQDINKTFKKTKAGNYFGYYMGYYVSAYKKPHGSWACDIGRYGDWLANEGHFGASLRTIAACKKWVVSKFPNGKFKRF